MADLKNIELLNQSTGQVESLDTATATKALADGTHSPRKGVDVPVKAQDGSIYFSPSKSVAENVQKYGMSIATDDEVRAASEGAYKAGVAASKEERFGDFQGKLDTGIAGALDSYTGGISNVIANKMGAKDALRTAAEVNPKSYIAGQVVGAFGPGGGVAGAVGREAAGLVNLDKIGRAVRSTKAIETLGEAAPVLGRILTPQEQKTKIAGQILQKMMQGGAEGATAGLGSAIGSTALKEGPMSREDVDNLIYSTVSGGVFGGVLGGAIEGGSHTYSAVAPKIGEAVEGISEGFRKNVASKILGNSSTRAEAESLANLSSSAWSTPIDEARALERSLNAEQKLGNRAIDAQDKAAKAAFKAEQQAAKAEAKDLRESVNNILKDASEENAAILNDAVEETGGDLVMGVRNIYKRADDLVKQADQAALASQTLPQVQDKAAAAYAKLKASLPKNFVREGMDKLEQEAASIGDVDDLREEFDQLRMLKREAGNVTKEGNLQNKYHNAIKEFQRTVTELVDTHPEQEIAKLYLKSDDLFRASAELAEAMGVKKLSSIKPGQINEAYAKAALDPNFGSIIDVVAKNAPELASELQAFAAAGRNVERQNAVLRSVQENLEAGMDKKASIEDLRSAFNAIGPTPTISGRLNRLQELQAKLKSMEAGPPNSANTLRDLKEALGVVTEAKKSIHEIPDIKRIDAARRDSITKSAVGRQNEGWLYTALATTLGHPTAVALLGLKRGLAVRQDAYRQAQLYRGMRAAVATGRNLVDGAMTKVLNGLNTTPGRVLATKGALALNGYAAEADKVRAAEENLHNENSVVVRNMEPYQGVPEVQERIAEHSTNTIQFLASKLPKPTVKSENSFLPPRSTVSDAEKTKFLRYAEAAQNPISVLDSIANGRVTAEQVETIQTLHPELYAKVKTGIVEKLAEPGIEIPYQRRLNLSVLFNVPGDPSLAPSQFSMLQASYAPAPDKGGRPTASKGSSTETTSESTQSETDRLTFQ